MGSGTLEDLVHPILVAYHRPLQEELPRLESMAQRVLEVHGDKDPETLAELVEVFARLKAELDQHMVKEEQILFPMIKEGQGAMAGGPVSVMKQEHDSAGAALRRLRELTKDYQVPRRRVIPGEPSGTDSPLWRYHFINTSTWRTTSFFPGRWGAERKVPPVSLKNTFKKQFLSCIGELL